MFAEPKPPRRAMRLAQLSKSNRLARRRAGVSEAVARFNKVDIEMMMRRQQRERASS